MYAKKLAIGLAALIALASPAVATAKMYDIDENGNTTPQNEDNLPDGPEPGSGVGGSGPVWTPADATMTFPASGSSACTYRVEGRLVIRNPRIDGMANNTPVAGVEVKVSGRSGTGWYTEWDTVTTDADGDFSVAKVECSNRRIKVEARFENDDLHVTSSDSKGWYELHDTGDTISPSTLDLGNEPFGGESGDQLLVQAKTDAQTWIVYHMAMDRLGDIAHPMLQNTVTVHNPATLTSGASAADPILHDIHIDPTHRDSIDAMLHELGHIWAYPRMQGEGCLTWDAIINGDTHDEVEIPCVAFNEAFAEVFGDKLELELIDDGRIATSESEITPWNRAQLEAWGATELRFMFPIREDAWQQLFRVLLAPDVTTLLFGDSESGEPGHAEDYVNAGCAGNGQPFGQDDLADLLRVIGDANDQIDVGAISVDEVMDRAEDRLATFDATDNREYTNAINPQLLVEPHNGYSC